MDGAEIISTIKNKLQDFNPLSVSQKYPDEVFIKVAPQFFRETCLAVHKIISSPVMMLFASDERKEKGVFVINSIFMDVKKGLWIIVSIDVSQENPCFDSLAKVIHSAMLFEREMREMFGIEPKAGHDLRRLNLHDESWPQGNFPLRKDFEKMKDGDLGEYKFGRVDGEGIFEVPVGPVHAGIIGPGHFRFSSAGEPIINLEIRLGWAHRGVEKIFEGKLCDDAIGLSECVSGDSAAAHSLAFVRSIEKISGLAVPQQAEYLRAIFLELERMYNHVNDIGGMALDVGFTFPAQYASIIKEAILQLNEKITGARYLKKVNTVGGVSVNIDETKKQMFIDSLKKIKMDFSELVKMLNSSVSFMDRVDTTGVLKKKTAEDLGVIGLAGRASGIGIDLRKHFRGVYRDAKFKMMIQGAGDCLARLNIRILEFEESCRLIEEFCVRLKEGERIKCDIIRVRAGSALGYAEAWRGPVLYWIETDPVGLIKRCKIVDPSFHNWQALSYAVLGNIIPDFPLCNKSFDLSYSGNDL